MTVQKNLSQATPLVELGLDHQPATPDSLDLRSLLRMVVVRRRLILGAVLAVLALTLAAVYSTTPLYDAHAVVLLDQRENKIVDTDAVMSGLTTGDPTTIENQMEILRSRGLMLRVIANLGLGKGPAPAPLKPSVISKLRQYANPLNWIPRPSLPTAVTPSKADRTEALVSELLGGENVSSIGRSSTIEITYRSSNPAEAARRANAIADAYVEEQLSAKYEATQKTSQWLASRLQELSSQMQAVDAEVDDYKSAHNIAETSNGSSVLDQQLGQLNAQLITARSDLAEAQAKYAQAKQLQASGQAEDLSQISQSGMIAQLRSQQAELLREQAQYRTTFGPLHPKMLDLEAQLKDVNTKITEEVSRVVATVANDVAVANAHVQALQTSLADLEKQEGAQRTAGVQLTELQARSASAHQLYEAFLAKFKETQGQETMQTPDSRVISRAVIPTTPSAPNIARDVEIAVVGGLILGFMLALAAERLVGGVQTIQQLENLVGLSVLSTIPELPRKARRGATDYILERPASAFAESVRGLQMALVHSDLERRPKTILITSSVPDEGKTTVAICLARIFARNNKKVLLIDCDLRKPSVGKALNIEFRHGLFQHGLLNVLSGDKTLEESVIRDPRSTVQCLLSLRVPANSADVLGSPSMENLIARVKKDWDYIIIDSAPLLPVHDTKNLADIVDTVAFVVRWEKTQRQAIMDGARSLRDISARVAGAVLARTDISRFRYYSYGYGHKYSYDKYYND